MLAGGPHGPVANFDSHYYLTGTTPSQFKSANQLTYASWIYIDPAETAANLAGCFVFAGWYISLVSSSGLKLQFDATRVSDSQLTVSSTSNIPTGQWVHIAVVFNTAVGTSFYLNGKELNTNTTTGTISYGGSNTFRIGASSGVSPTNFFGGKVDSVYIWNRALTDTEIGSLFSSPYSIFENKDLGYIAGFFDAPFTMSGGIIGSGTATSAIIYNPSITPAGARLAGTAINTVIDVNVATGGIRGGSTATPTVVYNPSVVAAGARLAGTGLQTFTDSETMVGGARLAGSALNTVIDVDVPTGGIRGGSVATPTVIYNPSVVAAGARLAGLAIETKISVGLYNETMSGGIECGSSAINTVIDINIPTGGIAGGSSATPTVIYNPSVVAAGVRLAGVALNTVIDVNIPTGGIAGGSAATLTVVNNPVIISAGARLAGAALNTVVDVNIPTGGIAGGSTATPTVIYNPVIISAGAALAGTAIVALISGGTTYNETMSGGIKCGSSAINTVVDTAIPIGGIAGGSAAIPTVIYNPSVIAAGARLAASGIQTFNDSETMAGGIRAGSAAIAVVVYNPSITSAGARLAGVALNTVVDNIIATGGVSGGSAATPTVRYNPTIVSAGVMLAGAAIIAGRTIYNQTMVGGVLADGSSDNYTSMINTPLGGVVISGTSIIYCIYTILPTGDSIPLLMEDGSPFLDEYGQPIYIEVQYSGGLICSGIIVISGGKFQTAVPIQDIDPGDWIFTPLYEKIDEDVPDNSDYISSAHSPINSVCEVKLSSGLDPGTSEGHSVNYRYNKTDPNSVINLEIQLRQGVVIIANWTHLNVNATWVEAQQVLTSVQADSITDYSDLRLRFIANKV